jgi:predicted transcriptional regulator
MKKTLIIETVSSPAFTGGPFNRPEAPSGEREYRIRYEDPVELLQFMTAERMEIVKLLREVGPLLEQEIAIQTGRYGEDFADDLRTLLASEVLRLNAKYEYCFDYDGVCVTLEWPLPAAKSGMEPVVEPRTHVDGHSTDASPLELRTLTANPGIEYARRVVPILMGVVVVLVVISVIMFLNEH